MILAFTVTALDVALVSATAAVVAPLTSWLSTKATFKHERRQRVRDDKRNAYVRVLREAHRKQEWMNGAVAWIENGRRSRRAREARAARLRPRAVHGRSGRDHRVRY